MQKIASVFPFLQIFLILKHYDLTLSFQVSELQLSVMDY